MTGDKQVTGQDVSGYQLSTIQRLIAGSELPATLRSYVSGPFGLTSLEVGFLEQLSLACDSGFEAHRKLEATLLEQLADLADGAPSVDVPELQEAHRLLLGAFSIVVTVDVLADWGKTVVDVPVVEGALELDGLEGLLVDNPPALFERMLGVLVGFTRQTASKQPAAVTTDEALQRTLLAGLMLLKNSVLRLAESGRLRHLHVAVKKTLLHAGGHSYRGLERVAGPLETDESATLLDISVDDIVGNTDYLAAAQRLARDVAGFDLEAGVNPKKLNPVLFALGRPGCGKTVTAHAVGRYFLDYCKARSVPAKFLVIRRSDWASSYQNASASNLLRLFEEQVQSFDGVCGIYWPDIDTALASRDSGRLRTEEKQNLAAVFGVFDGTILPKDGSWFMLCDANTLHMDEAAISRIVSVHTQIDGDVHTLFDGQNGMGFVLKHGDGWRKRATVCS